MSSSVMPPELLDIVLDHLHDDQRTLLACSLVPDLLHSSRYHLFSDLHILPCTSSIFALLHILRCPTNTIAPYARRLVFDKMTKLVSKHSVTDVVRAVRNLPILTTGTLLPHLATLRLSNTDFDHVPTEVLALLVYVLRGFTAIELHELHFSRFAEVVNVLSGFTELQRASLSRVTWTHGGSASRLAMGLRRPSPCVEWHIDCGQSEDLDQWLGRQAT